MDKKYRMGWLILVIGIVLGLGLWQQQSWAAQQAGNGLKQASAKLKQLFSPEVVLDSAQTGPTLTVNTTDDPGDGACTVEHCSLREAITLANSTTSINETINFNIPGAGPHTIVPTTLLPNITDTVTIDGLSQPANGGSSPSCTAGPLLIEIAVPADSLGQGFRINSSSSNGSTIRGIAISGYSNSNDSSSAGIAIGSSANNTIQCNFLGANTAGTARSNGGNVSGVLLSGAGTTNNLIGTNGDGTNDANERNLLSGNSAGVQISSGTSANIVAGNYIGTDVTGVNNIGNTGNGVFISQGSTNNTVGFDGTGTAATESNLIRFNGNNGVRLSTTAGTGNRISANRIFGNTFLGINLDPFSVTPNDSGDVDTGPNNLQNFPVITGVTSSGSNTTVNFTLDSNPGNYTIEFFSNPTCDGTNGEGEVYLGRTTVTLPGGPFSITTLPATTAGSVITTTAIKESGTDGAVGDTSEFSACAIICTTPPISIEPVPQAVCAGAPASFSVSATGTGLSYQWRKDGSDIPGATASSYMIASTTVAHAGGYDVVVTGTCGTVTSQPATLTVNPVPSTPTITANGPTTLCEGGNVSLSSSSATGNQWYRNGNPISGATAQSYVASAAGSYTVVVASSGCASASSAPTVVTVNPAPATPTITAGGPTTFCESGSVLLTSSSATGNQWYRNGSPISGATAQSYSSSQAGSYTVIVTANGCASTASAATVVTVNPVPSTPTITANGPTTLCEGGNVSLSSSSATGNQWYLDGNPINGATAQSYDASAAGDYTVTVTTSGCVSASSAPTVVTVNPAPATPTIAAGGPTTFCESGSVLLTSSSATGNQWYRNGNPINGATAQSYSSSQAGSYTVIVMANGCASTASAATVVTVNPVPSTPTITANGPTTLCEGGNVSLSSSSATGNQWYLDGNPISGAISQSYVASAAGSYTVVVTSSGCASASSAPTVVTVNPTPATPTITAGGPTTFCESGSVLLTSSSATGNQWYRNGSPISGATAQSYDASAAGDYTVIVTTSGCVSASSAPTVVTVNPAPATPTIAAGGPTTFCESGSVLLTSSSATGNQWYRNGSPISGATAQSYSSSQAGSYTVIVTANGCASAASAATVVTVNPVPSTPTITANGPTTLCEGGSVSLSSSSATGNQWYLDGNPISGATGQSYVASAAGDYTVIVTTSGCGSVASAATTVTVNPMTAIVTPPASQTVNTGQSVTFSVTASGADLNYQWRKGGLAINDATDSSYTIASVASGDAGNYDVVVSGLCGNVPSSMAALTVNTGGCATPVVSITGPASGAIYAVGTPVNFTGAFTDSSGETHTATWTFDAIAQPGVVNESAGTVSASHPFTQAGVYQVTLAVSNSCGEHGTAGSPAMVVVYDPSAGFVTGNGSIVSPPGAYVPNPSLTGNATFGFVSKYTKGNNVPTGDTEFQFVLANLAFKSTAYEWLVVSGARAQYKGSGTINDAGDYRFILTAIDGKLTGDGGKDKFRIRIWNNQGGGLVYDNQINDPDSADPTTVIGGGQIIIHTNGNGKNQAALPSHAADEINGEGQLREAEVEWQIILGDEGGQQSFLRGGSGAPYFDVIAPGDYDGDGQPDLAIFRRANGNWLIKRSTDGGLTQLHWGLGADLPVAADYDGDGKTDIAVWRGATGQWFILRSSDGAKQVIVLGAGLAPFNDQPAPADYDGDGKADVAVWRAADGKRYALGSASNSVLTKTGEPPANGIRQ